MKKYWPFLFAFIPFIYLALTEENSPKQEKDKQEVLEKSISEPQVLQALETSKKPKKIKRMRKPKASFSQAHELNKQRAQKISADWKALVDEWQKQRIMPFQVKDGLAIVHGSIVLGEPPAEFKDQVGFTEFPEVKLWHGVVPYVVEKEVELQTQLREVMDEIESYAKIQFIPATSEDEDVVVIKTHKDSCYSQLGRVGGYQAVYLSANCQPHHVAHELMHTLGFIHEHSRPNRDDFVKVNWDYVKEDFEIQFVKWDEILPEAYDRTDFDYESIMIYPPIAFAKEEGKKTLESVTGKEINPKPFLSKGDIEKLRLTYGY